MSPRADAHRYLLAYDVPDDKRRARLAKELQKYGDRVQYSVFVADLSPAYVARLTRAARDIMDTDADSLLICDLGIAKGVTDKRFVYVGRTRPTTDEDSFVL